MAEIERHDTDGQPYLAYFDRGHTLGFVWDGDLDSEVQVQRELGEPIIDTFGIPLEVWDANTDLSTAPALAAFKACCQWYIDRFVTTGEATCRHCGRRIVHVKDGGWIDPEAGYDDENGDGIWRETCDANDTVTADHEPGEDSGPTEHPHDYGYYEEN